MAYIPPLLLLDAVTTGTSKPVSAVNSARDVTVTYTGNGTTSGGTVLLEESDQAPYTGTWSLIETVSASTVTGNAKAAHHIRIGAGLYVRARVSSDMTGGGTLTVSVTGA